jgi:hypothetical protein
VAGVISCYCSLMLRRHTIAERNIAMRNYWLYTRAQGKKGFIRSEMLLGLLVWTFICPVMDLWKSHGHLANPRTTIVVWLSVLAICLLGSYLTGKWRWNDFEKNHPEDDLPPSE